MTLNFVIQQWIQSINSVGSSYCGVIQTHFNYICILVLITLKMATGVAVTCQWPQYNKYMSVQVWCIGWSLTLGRLMSYIMEHPFLMFLDHTQRRSTVGVCDLETSRIGAPYMCVYIYIYDISSLRFNDLTLILLTWRKWWANNASK